MDPALRRLLILRRDQLLDAPDLDLGEFVHIVVVRPGDTLEAIEAEAGIPIATNLVDGTRLGDPDFTPSFEVVRRHGCWLEGVIILTDDGFAFVLFVPDRVDVDPALPLLLSRAMA